MALEIECGHSAFENYLNEQKWIHRMPGLSARPCFLAGYKAGHEAAKKEEALASQPKQGAGEKPSTLGEQVKAAQAEYASWSDADRAAVRLNGGDQS